ncbi:MAG: hypothetical protein Q8K74_01430, partial [Candidatus Nitrotoga sp.]|nr:hypothetical protein [Candidatus Nitrotoga sp.]MDP1854700.1 hypothetical protein [Candidatus Nitrotoga sp.]
MVKAQPLSANWALLNPPDTHPVTQLPPTKVGGLRLRPPPTKSGQTVADSAKTIFTERMMKLIVFKTLNA